MKGLYVINDEFALSVDPDLNWNVMQWREASEITFGKHKGKMSEAKWKSQEVFFPHASQALRYIQKRLIASSEDVGTIGDLIEDYELLVEKAEVSLRGLEDELNVKIKEN